MRNVNCILFTATSERKPRTAGRRQAGLHEAQVYKHRGLTGPPLVNAGAGSPFRLDLLAGRHKGLRSRPLMQLIATSNGTASAAERLTAPEAEALCWRQLAHIRPQGFATRVEFCSQGMNGLAAHSASTWRPDRLFF
jgi:hypothetical protein